MASNLIVVDQLNLTPVVRRKRHAAKALPAVDRLLEEIGTAPDPVLALAGSLAGESEHAASFRQDWAELVRAHALDLYADAGMEALAWPQALGEALFMLVRLRNKEGEWMLQVPGLVVEILPSRKTSTKRPSLPAPAEASLLTMDEVARQLSARSCVQAWKDTEELCDLLPHANLPRLALATGALQALAIAGPLSGFERMTLGDGKLGWMACVHWPAAQQAPAR